MIVCIDTNVLLQAAKPDHNFTPIISAWFRRQFRLAVSTAILAEYEEIITRLSGPDRWRQLERVFHLADARGDLLMHVSPSFRFQVITADPDDNKFTDCAITANADYVVTEDRHFDVLADAGYKPLPISPAEFIRHHLNG